MSTDLREQLQTTLGVNYTLERELGGGGMSRVFVAQDARLGRRVVVKVLHPDMAATVSASRFEREVRLAARLQHPHVVPLFTAGETGRLLYYTMPYIEGESLRQRLAREGRLPLSDALRLIRELADAMEYAHGQGVVHRDLKPENVLLSGGHATVADFGIATALSEAAAATGSITATNTVLGTPLYMAPEQAAGDPATDHRADLYALGLIAYELLAGAHPFAGRPPQATLVAHLTETPVPLAEHRPDVPPALGALVARLLAKAPNDRPQTAAEVIRVLDTTATPGARTPPAVAWLGSAPRRRALAALVVLTVAIVAALATFALRRTSASAPPVLVVLPFENLGSPSDAYFADGLTDEVTGRLAGVSGLRVIGRTSARQYKGTTKGPREIARELGATHLLTGTVRWERTPNGAGRVRVSPELVRASDQSTVWTEPYEGPLEDVFRMQSSVAERVAAALDVTLLARERRAVTARPTENLAAYDAYLRGLAASSRAGRYSAPGRRAAVTELERAVALDPTFAAAHAALARAYLATLTFSGDPGQLTKARSSAERAVALAPGLAESQRAHASYLLAVGRLEDALPAASAAVREAPADPVLLVQLSHVQRALGRYEDAVATLERAERLDPRSPDPPADLAGLYDALDRYEQAIQARDREIALSPENIIAYAVQATSYLLWRADTAAARRVLERAGPSVGTAVLARIPDTNVGQGLWSLVLPPAALQAKDTLTFEGFAASGDTTRELYHFMKLRHYARAGRLDRARIHADSIIGLLDPSRRPGVDLSTRLLWRFSRPAMLAEAFAYRGRTAEAARVLDRYVVDVRRMPNAFLRGAALCQTAYLEVLAGRRDVAVARLAEVLEEPNGFFISRALLRADPSWGPLRGHPGFERLIAGGA
ncbi:MAG TPA: protein kinase [Gemmatimonadaceae bacterium]|nr:protein kinase [Gemmatimonadaceae bacterium]